MKKLRIKFKRSLFDKEKLSKWAKSVKKRDNYKCVACGYTGYLHSHHILPKSKYPKYAYSLWNGVTLCKLCHLGKNGVHRKLKARNEIVSKLRVLLKCNDINSVKNFSSKLKKQSKSNTSYTRYSKIRRWIKKK